MSDNGAMLYYGSFRPRRGVIVFIAADDQAVRSISLNNTARSFLAEMRRLSGDGVKRDGRHPLIRLAGRQLTEYFRGKRREFDFPLELRGTRFQERVWEALLSIPYGQTRSYGQIARALGVPGAARAVGGANHANQVAIVVPCHRVINADGSLGGYGGKPEVKRMLLDLERAAR